MFELFEQISNKQPGLITKSSVLGISCVENDPANRAFYYMIAIEKNEKHAAGLETYRVPAFFWAVFECVGKLPESIVRCEFWMPIIKRVEAGS